MAQPPEVHPISALTDDIRRETQDFWLGAEMKRNPRSLALAPHQRPAIIPTAEGEHLAGVPWVGEISAAWVTGVVAIYV